MYCMTKGTFDRRARLFKIIGYCTNYTLAVKKNTFIGTFSLIFDELLGRVNPFLTINAKDNIWCFWNILSFFSHAQPYRSVILAYPAPSQYSMSSVFISSSEWWIFCVSACLSISHVPPPTKFTPQYIICLYLTVDRSLSWQACGPISNRSCQSRQLTVCQQHWV